MSSDTFNTTGTCEGCSTHFSLFKRKKLCSICKQDFCQSCLTRQPQTRNSTKERICITCQSLSSLNMSVDDIEKHKTKHLRLYLQAKGISTNTCKEKRELAELIIRHNIRNNGSHPPPPPPSQQQQQHQPRNFNDKINEFMNGVHNFVNSAASSSNNSSPTRRNSRTTTTTTTTVNDDNNQPQTASFTTNVNDLLNFIGESIPPVIQQTINNNRFTFNNVFNSSPNQTTTTTTNTSNGNDHDDDYISDDNDSNQQATPTPQQQQQQQQNRASNIEESTGSRNIKRRASVSELTNEEDIDNLTVRQMKEILTSNFVDYKGVCERNELIERVKTLFKSHTLNKRLTEELSKNDDGGSKLSEDDLCKICMDSVVDCVLLDCGHMISCTKCGKRLAECPMCRKNIIKVVRVFKS